MSSSSVPLRENQDSVTLTCSADSNPPPTFVWLRSGQDGEVGRGPVLTIDPVDRTHIDTYSCIATNSLGSSKAKSVDVDVYCKIAVSEDLCLKELCFRSAECNNDSFQDNSYRRKGLTNSKL